MSAYSEVSVGDATLSGDQLAIPVTVSEAASVDIYMGYGGPKDTPENLQQVVRTESLPAGLTTVYIQVPVGAKIAYSASAGDVQSSTKTVISTDTSEYRWVNNAVGDWEDPANWTRSSDDGYMTIGYPAYTTGNIRFYGNQTAEVALHADYSSADLFVDNSGLNLTLRGNGHTFSCGNTHCTHSNTFVLDDVRLVSSGSYTLGANSSMRLVNGAYFSTTWEFNVNGTNAKLYVGPGCEIYASTGWWWTFRLDGSGAEVVLDNGYIHSRGFRVGSQVGDVTPKGFTFRGSRPRLELNQEFVVCKSLSANPVFEFEVPVGGYETAPIRKTDSGNDFPALDNKWQDHTTSTSVYSPVLFKVSPFSPFYQDEGTRSVCLFDWSKCTEAVPLLADHVRFAECGNPEDNYLEFRSSDDGAMDQVWAVLTGTGTPADLPSMAQEITVTKDSSIGKITFGGAITALSTSVDTKVQVYIGATGPNADPTKAMRLVDTIDISETGPFSYEYNGILGTQVAYRFLCVGVNEELEKSWGSSEVAGTVIFPDTHTRRYNWKNGNVGEWSDPDNWTLDGADDGLPRIGYPTWGANAGFYSATDVVHVDANYAEINEIILGWGGAKLTFFCTNRTDGAIIECGGFRDGQYDNVDVTLDGVSFETLGSTYPGTYAVKNNSSLRMYNGARLRTRWAFTVEGANAYAYIGTNCQVVATAAEPYHRIGLAGENAEIVLDGGKLIGLYLSVGSTYTSETPKGITFKGKNPRLELDDHMGGSWVTKCSAIPGSPVFSFEVPEGGYDSAPIVRTGTSSGVFFPSAEGVPPVVFSVSRTSPCRGTQESFTKPLLDWSLNGGTVDTAGVVLSPMSGMGRLYYTPEDSAAKSGVAMDYKPQFTVIIAR